MAEIEIDLKLPGQESLDINSPYSEVNANVNLPENYVATIQTIESSQPTSDIYIVGPQGPEGQMGPSGAIGPSGEIGPQGPQGIAGSGIVNTGELDLRYYSINNPSGFITGLDLSTYATIINLQNTGSLLDNKINSLSGYVNNQDVLISNNLISTGTILISNINNLISTDQTLNAKIDSLSGSSVLLYGDQTIDGAKTFRNSVYIHDLYVTGNEFIANVTNNFIESPYLLLNLTGGAFDGGIFFVTGVGLTGFNDYGPIIGFDHTDKFKFGIARRSDDLSTLPDIASVQQIQTYSGFVDNKYATIINLISTGNNLQTQINNLYSSGFITGVDLSNYYTKDNPSGFITGVDLSNYVTKINGEFNNRPTVNGTGILLSGEAANVDLSSTVQITGDQNIDGIKNFISRPTLNGNGIIAGGDTIDGDLTGYLPSPTINKIQGYQVDLGSPPAAGQTLQWNGSSWVAGSIPVGGNGGGGRVYYFNFGNYSGIAPTGGLPTSGNFPLSLLGREYSIGSGQAQSADLAPQNTYKLICGFVSASGDAGITSIPAGLWDFNIWAKVNSSSATQSSIKATVNIYNPFNSTYRKIAESDDLYLYETDTIAQYILNVTVPQTGILSTERIYVEIYGRKYTTVDRKITLYFDSYRPSHIHTTIPSVLGNGVVKVINGVYQSPATGIFNIDVDENANIAQSKIANLTSDLNTLIISGQTLDNKINSLSGNLILNYVTKLNGQFDNRPTINGTGVLLIGEAANVDLSSTVQITGDQNISGIKNFYNRPTVNGTGILLSGESAGALEKRHDFITGSPYDFSYCGTAPQNSLESANVWDITRLSIDSAGLVAFNQSVTNYSWTGRYLAPYV